MSESILQALNAVLPLLSVLVARVVRDEVLLLQPQPAYVVAAQSASLCNDASAGARKIVLGAKL